MRRVRLDLLNYQQITAVIVACPAKVAYKIRSFILISNNNSVGHFDY